MTLHLYSPPATTTTTSAKHALSNTMKDSHDNNANSNKRRKKTVCRRIPCKARGLSNDHNTDTAFFDVPLEAPHGLLLSCSHPECQDSGRRFRYCQVCALPVAKRNFLKRHGHGLIKTNKELKRDVDRPASCQFIYQDDDEDATSSMPYCLPTLDSLYSRQEAQQQAPSPPPIVIKPAEHRRVVSFDGSKQPPQATGAPASSPAYVTDSSGTDSSIASASDEPMMNDDLDLETDSGLTHDEKEWLAALYKQPDANDPSCMSTWMANMTEWMDKVVPAAAAAAAAQPTMDPALTAVHVPNPLSVPNPLYTPPPSVMSSSCYSPTTTTTTTTTSSGAVPVTPPLAPRQVMSAACSAAVPPVPLASPGKCITETDFMAAIDGVDFSKVFD